MVAGPGGRRGAPARLTTGAELTTAVRASYEAAAGGWASGPGRMYDRLAAALIAAAPVPLAGRRVLDLGAGTGAAGRAALAAGAAQVVAADLAVGMLRAAGPALHPVAADAAALPFRAGSFDLVAAAFCLNHLPDPAAALAGARRVSAALAASTFAPGWTHPAKDAVDAALRPFGYREPAWHACLSLDADRLADRAAAAGFSRVRVRTVTVQAGLVTPAELAAWRLGLAQFAPFLRSLDAPARTAARRAAERAVAQAAGQAGPGHAPLAVSMALVTAC
jgi:SAM-dependent methyltransferase